jgi:hypothetical protein
MNPLNNETRVKMYKKKGKLSQKNEKLIEVPFDYAV